MMNHSFFLSSSCSLKHKEVQDCVQKNECVCLTESDAASRTEVFTDSNWAAYELSAPPAGMELTRETVDFSPRGIPHAPTEVGAAVEVEAAVVAEATLQDDSANSTKETKSRVMMMSMLMMFMLMLMLMLKLMLFGKSKSAMKGNEIK